jgi:predicted ATP-dependent serine protease
MPRKKVIGARKPMSEETKRKIAEGVKKKARENKAKLGYTSPNPQKKDIELVKMKDQEFDPELFVPLPTGKLIDNCFTFKGGIPKATIYIVVGDPGSGKTTICLDVLADLQNKGYKGLYVSSEMTRIDMYPYTKRYPKFGNIDMLFLAEYQDDNPKAIMEELVQGGYDMIVIDSFVETQESVSETSGITMKSAEKWLVDLMINQTMANNKVNKNTSFLAIQQVTKEGVFVGSNKLKHNTTGMLEIRFDDKDPNISYLWFTKNRRGKVKQKLYYSLTDGNVEYRETRLPNNDISEIEDVLEKGIEIELPINKENPFEIK